MPPPPKPFTVAELARELGGEALGDGSVALTGVAALDDAGSGDIAFVDGARHQKAALASRAGCLIVPGGVDCDGRAAIRVDDPKRAFARAVLLFHPPRRPPAGRHPSAAVDPAAEVAPDAHVGPHVAIGAGAVIGPRAVIGPGSVIGEGARVGADSVLVARVVLYPGVTIGERALVHAGVVLGSDGFGFVRAASGLVKFPQVGRLEIGDDVEIGANTTIDRGALGATVIGSGTKIDNLVQIAHNVQVGEACAISAQVGIAGSSQIEPDVTLAGQVGIADHVRIERGAIVGAQAGVPSGKTIRKEQVVWGTPARPLDEFKKQYAHLSRIAALREQVRELEERVRALEGGKPSPPLTTKPDEAD